MRPVRKADNLTTILCRCQEIWEFNFLEPSGPPQASNGTALPLLLCLRLAQVKGLLPIIFLFLTRKFIEIAPLVMKSQQQHEAVLVITFV
jgi:hypothetical protein